MGGDDGSIFIFSSATRSSKSPPELPSTQTVSSIAPSPTTAISQSHRAPLPSPTPSRMSNRSTSTHTHHLPPLAPSRASVITSGVSKAQVEAPKTFVDYEAEPDHLRAMLKTNRTGDASRRRSRKSDLGTDASGALSPSTTISGSGEASPASERRPPTSPVAVIPTLPTPINESAPSDKLGQLALRVHITPPRSGSGHAVASLKVFDDSSSMACLQECG